ncbi:hypothetical protein [Crateriforma conspicua]|nr:hypothetical protein [Crateriforma conspicua]
MAAMLHRDRTDLHVLAIGRFVPAESVTRATPWAISVQTIDGRRLVIRSESDLPADEATNNRPAAGMLF